MKIEKGIGKMVLIRITKGGAVTAFDFRERASEKEVVCFRVYDRELPPDLSAEFEAVVSKIGQYARENKKFAALEELRNTLNVFEAREKMTKDLESKMTKILAKGGNSK